MSIIRMVLETVLLIMRMFTTEKKVCLLSNINIVQKQVLSGVLKLSSTKKKSTSIFKIDSKEKHLCTLQSNMQTRIPRWPMHLLSFCWQEEPIPSK
jgi:hypothetical protein